MNKIPVLKIRDENGNIIPVNAIRGEKGKDAYEQAKEGGYDGTEEEFIAMLNGLTAGEHAEHYANLDNPHQVTAQQVGALPITGGQLEGGLGLIGEGDANTSEIVQNSDFATIFRNKAGGIETILSLTNESKVDVADVLKLWFANGNGYSIYGEHNKPTASEVGAIPETYYVSGNLDIELQQGGDKMVVCCYTENTLNTPHKEGLTDCTHGMVITNAFNSQYATQLSIPSGEDAIYVRRLNGSGISKWVNLADNDSTILKNIDKHCWKRQMVEASVAYMWSEPKNVQRVLGSSGSQDSTFTFYTSSNIKCTFNTETRKCELSLDSPKAYTSTNANAGNTSAYFQGKYWSFASDGSAPIYYSESDISVSGGWLAGTGYHITVPATLVRGVVRTTGEIENLYSESADAYPVGIQDNYLYTYIGIPEENLINSKKAVYGSYVGTGTFGSDSENELFFDTIPDVIIIGGNGYILPKLGTGIWFGGHLQNYILSTRTEGNTVYWYNNGGATYQLNNLDSVYSYVAI